MMRDFLAIYPKAAAQFHQLLLQLATATPIDSRLESEKGELRGDIAIIHIDAPIINAPVWAEWFGFSTVTGIFELLYAAVNQKHVSQIVLHFDSPGGTVTGIQELAQTIHQLQQVKPISSYVNGLCCSAAYWLASSTPIFIAETAIVGSIGVVQTFEKYDGIREIAITSTHAPNKRLNPETEDGQAGIRKTLDALEAVFIGDIANYRQVTRNQVIEFYGKGGVFVGRDASHMVNGVCSSNQFFTSLNGSSFMLNGNKTSTVLSEAAQEQINAMIFAAIEPEFKGLRAGFERMEKQLAQLTGLVAEKDGEINQLVAAREAEQQRVSGIEDYFAVVAMETFHGEKYQKLRADCLSDSACTPQMAQRKLIELRATLSATPQVPNTTGNTTFNVDPAKGKGFLELLAEVKAANPTLKHSDAMSKTIEMYPEAHVAYLAEQNPKGDRRA
jgi:ClpP class serine protease